MNNRLEIAYEFAKAIDSEDISKIIVYGSVARGDDDEESDIDILIVSPKADELMNKINSVAVDFILEKEEFISPHLMTEEHFEKTKDYPFLTNVLKEGLIIG
ncbi:MAG: nucleotidyltransferase domain-containing protein [Methanobrevibacter sp.]|nr:nucleotidyltransferase domain-containing protein [Methanobrevibacter sp.]